MIGAACTRPRLEIDASSRSRSFSNRLWNAAKQSKALPTPAKTLASQIFFDGTGGFLFQYLLLDTKSLSWQPNRSSRKQLAIFSVLVFALIRWSSLRV
jgi:hypothetical protein